VNLLSALPLRSLRRHALSLARLDGLLYVLWAAICTLASARQFYGYMLKQTSGEWSAPLDDVFIHFDYARTTANGHPFEWVIGNGYSSGNTSILYPFALAVGYATGFQGERLMIWAAIVAAVCVFGTLLAARALLLDLGRSTSRTGNDLWPRAASFLLPVFFLGLGSLNWSLWSGMEVAFFLGTWAVALLAARSLDRATRTDAAPRSWLLGLAGAAMILTRPEAATTIGAFGVASAITLLPRIGAQRAIAVLVRVALPSMVVLVAQAFANHSLTGEWSANGALVKLAINNPFLTPDEKLADYIFNLKYAVLRNVEYHFTDVPAFGFIIPALAFSAIAVKETRRTALLLWAQIAGWMLIVALNGQVRWQNERYTMPAVAWLLLVACLGAVGLARRSGRPNAALTVVLGALVLQAVGVATREPGTNPELRYAWLTAIVAGVALAMLLRLWPLRLVCVAAALFFAHEHQEKNFRDQKWFFGRASRNIRDQHIVAGRWLAELKPRRILVGDAGALIYASDRPGLDIIGLGGFHKLPFARAGVHGLPATLELLERIPEADRPDVLAIFPTWWGVLPTWFSSDVLARFPVEGNVICGGYEDVIYKADWHLLGTGDSPRHVPVGEVVKDTVDVADLVSEREHGYVFPSPAGGWTDMKILPDPADGRRDMFDGGRRIAAGKSERFVVRNLTPNMPAHLLLRSAPDAIARVFVRVSGTPVVELELERANGWVEGEAVLPAERVNAETTIEIWNQGPGDFVDYHAWVTQ
jgi:hypothetical protein